MTGRPGPCNVESCGRTDGVRQYPAGWRCPEHSPSRVAVAAASELRKPATTDSRRQPAAADKEQAMTSSKTAGLSAAVARRAEQPDDSIHGWLEKMQPELARALPAGGITADRLARIVLTEMRRNSKLAACTRESFGGALMTCAQLGLEPGSATGEAYLIPFGREVTLIIGYQGMAKLFWQSPLARSLDAQVVHENDAFEYEYGLEPKLRHKPSLGNRGEAYLYYAVATLTTGGSAFVVMSKADVEAIRARSKAKNDGPWKTDYDAMAKKTAVRQLFKLIPKSPQLAAAIGQDETVRVDYDPVTLDVLADGEVVDKATGEIAGRGTTQPPPKPAAVPTPAAEWVEAEEEEEEAAGVPLAVFDLDFPDASAE